MPGAKPLAWCPRRLRLNGAILFPGDREVDLGFDRVDLELGTGEPVRAVSRNRVAAPEIRAITEIEPHVDRRRRSHRPQPRCASCVTDPRRQLPWSA